MNGLPDFTVGGALRRTFDIVRRHALTLLALATVLYALPAAVVGLAPKLGWVTDVRALQSAAAAGEPLPGNAIGGLIAYGLVSVAIAVVGSLLATAAVVWVSYEALYGRSAGFGGGVARAFRALPANLGMAVLISLALIVGFALLVVPGIMLILRWSAAVPVLVVERAGVLGSLGRSRDLTRGHRWAILGVLVVLALIDLVVFGVIGFGGAALAASFKGMVSITVAQAINLAVNAMLSAFNGAGSAAIYFELRRAREGGLAVETAEAFA